MLLPLWVDERLHVQDLHALLPALRYRHSLHQPVLWLLSIICAIESNDKSYLCTTQTLVFATAKHYKHLLR